MIGAGGRGALRCVGGVGVAFAMIGGAVGCGNEVEGSALPGSTTVTQQATVTAASTAAATTTPKPTLSNPAVLEGIPTCDEIARQPGLPAFTDADHHDQDASFTAALRECEWRSDGQYVTVQIWHYQSLPHLGATFTNKKMLCGDDAAPPVGRSEEAVFCRSTSLSKCDVSFKQGHDLVSVEWGRTGDAQESACREKVVHLGGVVSGLLP
ncbi:hypothetical protein [Nocardia sp. NPDC050406]|uniref:hypothetical protein n=1 Tax=Nocardia sp. NPDC050406 TaxID=3364318 RepID=UPI0037AF8FD5